MAALTDDEIQILQKARDVANRHSPGELRLDYFSTARMRVALNDVVANHTLPPSLVGF